MNERPLQLQVPYTCQSKIIWLDRVIFVYSVLLIHSQCFHSDSVKKPILTLLYLFLEINSFAMILCYFIDL